jgi:hypothetical protein
VDKWPLLVDIVAPVWTSPVGPSSRFSVLHPRVPSHRPAVLHENPSFHHLSAVYRHLR